MKNVFKILGVIALVAVIGFGVVSCGGDSGGGGGGGGADSALNGTWTGEDGELILNNGNFEMSGFAKGTYTTNGNSITVTVTHINGNAMELENKWYTKDEIKTLAGAEISDEELNEMFFSYTGTYSISGNTLTINNGG